MSRVFQDQLGDKRKWFKGLYFFVLRSLLLMNSVVMCVLFRVFVLSVRSFEDRIDPHIESIQNSKKTFTFKRGIERQLLRSQRYS